MKSEKIKLKIVLQSYDQNNNKKKYFEEKIVEIITDEENETEMNLNLNKEKVEHKTPVEIVLNEKVVVVFHSVNINMSLEKKITENSQFMCEKSRIRVTFGPLVRV